MINLNPSPGSLRGPTSPKGRGRAELAGFIVPKAQRGAMRKEASSRTTSPFR
jgi:hypothetical protein